MPQKTKAHENQNLIFMKEFFYIFQDLMKHDGYSELNIKISQLNSKQKQVKLHCGREFTYNIHMTNITAPHRYKIIDTTPHMYSGPERRSFQKRRLQEQRRTNNEPRNFRLERRLQSERRSENGRRQND
jgi:hypothetical protein